MLEQLAKVLADALDAGPNVFVRFDPEVLDFTDPEAKTSLTIMGMGGNVATVSFTQENFLPLISLLKVSILTKGIKVIAWNWKSFLSYHLKMTNKLLETSVVDLKVTELYAGIRDKAPDSLVGALNRLKALVKTGAWKEMANAWQKVYTPLIMEVIPRMETVGILDMEAGKRVYASYEICGQENGRLKCSSMYKDGFVPHVINEGDKKRLKPRSHDEMFMWFDFKHYEVSVLQYLSKDEKLLEILENGDAYTKIYEAITAIDNDADAREKGKIIFLPVVYGQSAAMLAKRLKVADITADKIITRIYDLFPTAMKWVEAHQEQAKNEGYAKDCFGKRRHFDKGEAYLARNFSVQAPASTVSLEKLVTLHNALKGVAEIAYHVHDGYYVYASKNNWKVVFNKGYDALTSESQFCPGLRLKVACRAGRNLDGLKPLQKK